MSAPATPPHLELLGKWTATCDGVLTTITAIRLGEAVGFLRKEESGRLAGVTCLAADDKDWIALSAEYFRSDGLLSVFDSHWIPTSARELIATPSTVCLMLATGFVL